MACNTRPFAVLRDVALGIAHLPPIRVVEASTIARLWSETRQTHKARDPIRNKLLDRTTFSFLETPGIDTVHATRPINALMTNLTPADQVHFATSCPTYMRVKRAETPLNGANRCQF
jgi:hypothetical protein